MATRGLRASYATPITSKRGPSVSNAMAMGALPEGHR